MLGRGGFGRSDQPMPLVVAKCGLVAVGIRLRFDVAERAKKRAKKGERAKKGDILGKGRRKGGEERGHSTFSPFFFSPPFSPLLFLPFFSLK